MHLFTYGSLMFPEVWTSVVAGRYVSEFAEVSGYVRKRVRGDTYPAAVPGEASATLQGRLYFDIDHEDLVRLDLFEGEYYRREAIGAICSDGRPFSAAIYVLRPSYLHLLDHEDWDPSWFEREGMVRFISDYKGFTFD